jgi:hypothetical protein
MKNRYIFAAVYQKIIVAMCDKALELKVLTL